MKNLKDNFNQINAGNTDDLSSFDVLVAGKGLSGFSAALFSAFAGLKTAIAGGTSGCRYMTGLLDFLDIFSGHCQEPEKGLSFLKPDHPLRLFDPQNIKNSLDVVMSFLSENGLGYSSLGGKNSMIPTSAGTVRFSYGIPYSMMAGAEALSKSWPVLIVEFEGMKGFSAAQIAEGISSYCSSSSIRIPFPGNEQGQEFFTESAARRLDCNDTLERLSQIVLPHVKGFKAVGFPAMLGIKNTGHIIDYLKETLGVPVFEIPGLPPSVPGLRFEETMISGLEKLGVTVFRQNHISSVTFQNGQFLTSMNEGFSTRIIRSSGLVLSTGRFLSGGLSASDDRISEPLFGIPVAQPSNRDAWHSRQFFDPDGHPVNRSGIVTDEYMRPVGSDGRAVMDNLFASGTIIAGHDWKIEKCGASLSTATAMKAVDNLKKSLDGRLLASKRNYSINTGDDHGNIIFPKAV